MVMEKYLAHYAEPESRSASPLPRSHRSGYDHVLCLPAFAEEPDFLDTVFTNLANSAALVILVVNANQACTGSKLQKTRDIVAWLDNRARSSHALADNMRLLELAKHDVLLVDRCHDPWRLDAGQGVGKARKIACDIACRLIQDKCIRSHWMHVTDADARLPEDYFEVTRQLDPDTNSAALYRFQHDAHSDPAITQAQALYDLSLDYYAAGLDWAGSPWAFHTIGSTLAVSSVHYARVRGFPDREAGEDFYLLNKLAKTGQVRQLASLPIMLECRVSTRVPFGTGPALQKILALGDPPQDFTCYNPQCFVYLKCWLALMATLSQNTTDSLGTTIAHFCQQETEFANAEIDPKVLHQCLAALNTDKALHHARENSRSPAVFQRHMNNWFDAFMTLKFIHWLREHHLPSVPASLIQDGTCLPFAFVPGRNDPAPPASTRSQQSLPPGRPGH